VLSIERVEKYQRQIGLLSRLVSVIKSRGTVMKRTHLKISTVLKEVIYPPTIKQRTLTVVSTPHFMFGPRLMHTSKIVFKNVSPLVVFASLAAKSWRRACHTAIIYLLSTSLASCNLKKGFRRFVPHIICNNDQFSTPEKENAHCHSLQSFALILL